MAKKKGAKKYAKKVTKAKTPSITDSINSEVIAAALSSVNQPILLKVCRLCEAKDGPFLNIFDADKVTAKKIETVMPFGIAENDDLPHKICFRCSAKVEELYEFIQKCINTQKSLRKTVGAKGPIFNKPRHRELWEEKLNQSNITNDDICDALIKKAMEGIKDIPLNPMPLSADDIQLINKLNKKPTLDEEDSNSNDSKKEKETEMPTKKVKLEKKNPLQGPITKSLRSNAENTVDEIETKVTRLNEKYARNVDNTVTNDKSNPPIESASNKKNVDDKHILQTNTFSLEDATNPQPVPAFNIMDHVSMIKVNGVGVLFQCKICNRNFLKKEVVMSHACAKNGHVKVAGVKTFTQPEPPKIPSVKYINTKEVKKSAASNNENCQYINLDEDDDDDDDKPLVIKKPKPKIGPASRVKRNNSNTTEDSSLPVSSNQTQIQVKTNSSSNSTAQDPIVQFPAVPSLNTRYKLLPGPNNTFTLVEEKAQDKPASTQNFRIVEPAGSINDKANNCQNIGRRCKAAGKSSVTDNATDLSSNQPYPVGLFTTLPTNTCSDVPIEPEPAFTTPAMKKQSYTVVQTGNPSKLLISSKPQTAVQEVPKKRQRKTKHEEKAELSNKQPFSVTLEDTAPPSDPGFFTFINVDPLLQPSYVLPTNNIIQESQISTSTSVSKQSEKDKEQTKYTCNMCGEFFSREKKLLTHIQSHYSKMDEEDQMRSERIQRKRKK